MENNLLTNLRKQSYQPDQGKTLHQAQLKEMEKASKFARMVYEKQTNPNPKRKVPA